MTYTAEMKMSGRIAARSLSKKAFDVYASLRPFTLYEYVKDGEKLYAYRGCIGNADGLNFLELQGVFETLADMFNLQ